MRYNAGYRHRETGRDPSAISAVADMDGFSAARAHRAWSVFQLCATRHPSRWRQQQFPDPADYVAKLAGMGVRDAERGSSRPARRRQIICALVARQTRPCGGEMTGGRDPGGL
jgi:hypothetical protein